MLPIPKRVIALYRFFIQFILSNLLVLITFLSLYDLLKHGIGMMNYVGCAFFWSCLVGCINSLTTMDEAGFNMYESIVRRLSYVAIILVLYFSITSIWIPSGFVDWSMRLAQENLALSLIISILLLFLNLLLTYRFAKKMEQIELYTVSP